MHPLRPAVVSMALLLIRFSGGVHGRGAGPRGKRRHERALKRRGKGKGKGHSRSSSRNTNGEGNIPENLFAEEQKGEQLIKHPAFHARKDLVSPF